jgi:hypothetical protein
MNFAQAIEQWHDFYISLITASATLLGLLFIGISLNPQRMTGESDYRSTAVQTFSSFVYTLMIAFLFVIPDQTPLGVGIPLLFLGGFGLLQTIQNASGAFRNQTQLWSRRRIISRFGWPLVSFIGQIVIALTVISGLTNGLYWLVPVVLVLVGSSCGNAWQLLIHSAKAE